MYIFVGHEADEQFEALDLLLNQELFKHDVNDSQQELENRVELLSSSTVQQKLQNSENNQISSVVEIRPDMYREHRKGVPEIVYGETKNIEQIVAMARKILNESGRTIISRVPSDAVEVLSEVFNTYNVRVHKAARAVVIYQLDYVHRSTGGHVGIISAGTSDVPIAEEAALIAE